MKWIPFALLVLAGALLEAGNLLNVIAFHEGQVRPSVLLIMLVFFAVNSRLETAIVSSFVIGFAADLAGSVIGPYTVCFGLAGSLLAHTGRVITIRHPLHQVGVVFVTGLLAGMAASWLAAAKIGHPSGLSLAALAGTALYSGLASPLVWPVLQGLAARLYLTEPSRSRSASSLHV